ncbi:probable G-protein coupled receptor 139 isoform X1 [Heterodontus francisci]|uniref:probable G-protein coupled receptor 139 isoform X1 n=1 Tax=Heterodontus francisci TaxID=7792 RepID=UPI00355B363D
MLLECWNSVDKASQSVSHGVPEMFFHNDSRNDRDIRYCSQHSHHINQQMDRPILVQIEAVYYPFLAAVGVPANLLTIVILSRGKCGLSKCISRYMVAMTTADLLVLIFDVILYEIKEM